MHDDQYNKRNLQSGWKKIANLVGRVLIITMFLTGFNLSETSAQENKGTSVQTVYHIYSEGEYVGDISDEEKLNQLKEDKLKIASSEFEDLSLTIGTDISIVPERVFTMATNDDVVLEKLTNLLVVEAEAVGLKVDDELVFYVKDESDYDEVLHKLKLKSVSEQELVEFEDYESSTSAISPLKENETRIVNITMSADVQPLSELAPPEQVLTVDEAVTLLDKGTLEEEKYIVQSGDVLSKIATEHDMTKAELLKLNPDITDETVIQPGETLNVTVLEPLVEVETEYESKRKEIISYEKSTKNDNSLYKGDRKVTQKGSDGEKVVTELIQKRNGKVIERSIEEEVILVEPKEEITVVGTKVVPSRGVGSFKWPAVGGYVSSQMGTRWGRMHQGIDIARPSSRTILAADNGVVISAGNDGTYGNKIVIDHNNGYKTLYAHLSSINVKVGQTVQQGANIGIMGSTGRSTGIHLHFEVTKNGALVNPLSVLK